MAVLTTSSATSLAPPASPATSAPVERGPGRRPRMKRRWVVALSVLGVVAVVLAVVVAGIVVTEGRRLLTAQDIDATLGDVPGVADADVSYSYRPFSSERNFVVALDLDPEADATPVAEALADVQRRWRDSPLGDEAVATSVALTVGDEATLAFSSWDLPEEETARQVEYWSMLRTALGPEVTVLVMTFDGETESWLEAKLPPSNGTTATATELADRIETAASAAPPAGGWAWSVRTSSRSEDEARQDSVDTLGARPGPEALELWRGAATIASSASPTPELWLWSDATASPSTILHVTLPDAPGPDGTAPTGAPFVDGPHWADATRYAELVAAADDARLSIQEGDTFIADLSAQTCAAPSTPSSSAVEAALLEHLQATGADFC
ncbi:hypothetical protein [Sanguibacter sp. 25GB23B1]|uniref:hypothetical protein n=1 Tax=unclassified Sanguibacter TaxID=2645534 RepID=UPI0032B0117E